MASGWYGGLHHKPFCLNQAARIDPFCSLLNDRVSGMMAFSSSIHVDPDGGVGAFASTNGRIGGYRHAHQHDAERRIEYLTLAFGIGGTLVGVVLRGWRFGLGMAIGGALSWLNYRWLKGGIVTLARLSDVKPGEPAPRTPAGTDVPGPGDAVAAIAACRFAASLGVQDRVKAAMLSMID